MKPNDARRYHCEGFIECARIEQNNGHGNFECLCCLCVEPTDVRKVKLCANTKAMPDWNSKRHVFIPKALLTSRK